MILTDGKGNLYAAGTVVYPLTPYGSEARSVVDVIDGHLRRLRAESPARYHPDEDVLLDARWELATR
jgi:hypothetical protein